jgi:hypothetical protein
MLHSDSVYYQPKHQNFSKFSHIFSKMKLKNNVSLNLTTNTSKYHLDVSQLFDQGFTGFLLSLFSTKNGL